MNLSLRAALAAVVIFLTTVSPLRAEAVAHLADVVYDVNIPWQIAMDHSGFSPGLIDGKLGPKTDLAIRDFQIAHGLKPTGQADKETSEALGVDRFFPPNHVTCYKIRAEDLADVAPAPKGWLEKSRLDLLRYSSLEELVAEKFHASRQLLKQMNPQQDLTKLKVGDLVAVPNLQEPSSLPRADRIDINLSEKIIRLYAAGKEIALFHCSIAKDKAKLPSGDARVSVISTNPNYTFDPAKWPDVHGIDHKLLIPPGPRNPVGLCWVGLSLPGYGMHGTPTPELIGKTGSHGCFRLTNWDALRLGRMVSVGTPVHFSAEPSAAVALAADLPVAKRD